MVGGPNELWGKHNPSQKTFTIRLHLFLGLPFKRSHFLLLWPEAGTSGYRPVDTQLVQRYTSRPNRAKTQRLRAGAQSTAIAQASGLAFPAASARSRSLRDDAHSRMGVTVIHPTLSGLATGPRKLCGDLQVSCPLLHCEPYTRQTVCTPIGCNAAWYGSPGLETLAGHVPSLCLSRDVSQVAASPSRDTVSQ